MKWSKVNDYCIRSGEYQISKYTLSGENLFVVWHGGVEIGTADSGAKARKIAEKHSKGGVA